MRLKKKNLAQVFAILLVGALALAGFHAARRTVAHARVQEQSRSDVPAKVKKSTSLRAVPNGAGPSNDNCANAVTIASCPFVSQVSMDFASDEVGEPLSTCTAQENSVWYTLPASANQRVVTVDTCGSDFDTAIMVYQVTGAACAFAGFVPVACNDDVGTCGNGLNSSATFTAEAGLTYKIQAGRAVGDFDVKTNSLTLNVACQEILCENVVVNGTLGNGDPNFEGPQTSGQQTPARLFRDGVPSTCAIPKACPGPFGSGSFTFDAYTFTNESAETQCVTVQFRPNVGCNVNVHAITYLNSYSPTNLCMNYLADVGSSDDLDYSFEVPAGANFVVVIGANNPGGVGDDCAYQFTVVGNICEGFDTCVQDNSNPSRFIRINTTTGDYEFNDCSKGIVLTGTGAIGTSFCKIQLTDRGPDPKRPDRNVNVAINPCTGAATASVRGPGITGTVSLSDSNIGNNTCECP